MEHKLTMRRGRTIKIADTNCLSKQEHDKMMNWLNDQNGPQTIYDYLLVLIYSKHREDLKTAIKLCEHNNL